MAAYRLDQVFPAHPGWRAVWWTGQHHTTAPVYLLALATDTSSSTPGLIVALTYTPGTGWVCADTEPTFCGLLAPGDNLDAYEASDPKGHVVSGG